MATLKKWLTQIFGTRRFNIFSEQHNSNLPGALQPISHDLKKISVANYQKITNYKLLIETGTYIGIMVEAQLDNFKKIYSIELDEKLYLDAVEKFKNFQHVSILYGDSGKVLYNLMPLITEPTIFWLDGHYSGGITALGDKECPILEELKAIFTSEELAHLILIDDARLFLGKNDYPTVDELKSYIYQYRPHAKIKLEKDMIVCQL
jgi:hypothetical protein